MALTVQVTVDCADPEALARFWCLALGYQMEPPPEPHASWAEALTAWGVPPEQWNSRSACHDPSGVGPRMFFQQVPEPKTAKNRMHLDLRGAPGLRGEHRMAELTRRAEELVAHGATLLRREDPGPVEHGYLVLADPEGNEFCLD